MSRLIDLTTRRTIECYTLVRWHIPEYRENNVDAFTEETFRFCDAMFPIIIDTYTLPDKVNIDVETFLPLGVLLNVSATSSELRAVSQGITFSLTAFNEQLIGFDFRKAFLNSRLKGTEVEMWRTYIDPVTRQFVETDLPVGRFQGIVTNFSIDETWDPGAEVTTQTVVVQTASRVEQLEIKLSGCATNSLDRKKIFPNDTSFDRVTALKGSNFNFGAPV